MAKNHTIYNLIANNSNHCDKMPPTSAMTSKQAPSERLPQILNSTKAIFPSILIKTFLKNSDSQLQNRKSKAIQIEDGVPSSLSYLIQSLRTMPPWYISKSFRQEVVWWVGRICSRNLSHLSIPQDLNDFQRTDSRVPSREPWSPCNSSLSDFGWAFLLPSRCVRCYWAWTGMKARFWFDPTVAPSGTPCLSGISSFNWGWEWSLLWEFHCRGFFFLKTVETSFWMGETFQCSWLVTSLRCNMVFKAPLGLVCQNNDRKNHMSWAGYEEACSNFCPWQWWYQQQ